MMIKEKHYKELKDELEKGRGWLLRLHIHNKQYLVRDLLPKYPQEYNLGFEATSFQWNEFSNKHIGDDIYNIYGSFRVLGSLIAYRKGVNNHEWRKEVNLDVSIEVPCRYLESRDTIHYLKKEITVAVGALKTILDFDAIVLSEFERLSELKPLDRNSLSRLWPYNTPESKVHDFISSDYYFSEIDNMYRQIRYSIALARTYSHYANNYFDEPEIEPFIHYRIQFTSHDRRYLDHCTNAIHNMYAYWERLALLIFQYYQPKKVSAQNLSFKKIISVLLKEDEGQPTGIDLTWFKNFVNNDHVKLQEIRHPLVHFKLSDNGNKGSYVSSVHTTWLTNIGNKAELDQMANNFKNLHGELVQLACKCEEGFEKTVELIIELMNAAQNGGPTASNPS